jgi:hypothetical protein
MRQRHRGKWVRNPMELLLHQLKRNAGIFSKKEQGIELKFEESSLMGEDL